MPWREVTTMEERLRFVETWKVWTGTLDELADLFGISRKTAYKWIGRYQAEGEAGLVDRLRSRKTQAHMTPAAIQERLLALKRDRPYYGPKKVLAVLARTQPELALPAASTVGSLFARHGLVKPRRAVRVVSMRPSRWPLPSAPNEEWSADFKGQWRLGEGQMCFPLTVSDTHSRCLLGCHAMAAISMAETEQVMLELFRRYGLPAAIRTDNGMPFAQHGACLGLTRLAARWVRLGIVLHRTRPGKPTDNSRHERMHRTLKAETLLPIQADLRKQQRVFDHFRERYNQERPHESIGMATPASIYQPSSRPFPRKLPPIEYPSHFETRRVHQHGDITWRGQRFFVSQALAGQWLGLEAKADGWWVYYCHQLIANLDEEMQLTFLN